MRPQASSLHVLKSFLAVRRAASSAAAQPLAALAWSEGSRLVATGAGARLCDLRPFRTWGAVGGRVVETGQEGKVPRGPTHTEPAQSLRKPSPQGASLESLCPKNNRKALPKVHFHCVP